MCASSILIRLEIICWVGPMHDLQHAVHHVDDAVTQLGEPRELSRFALQRHALQLVEDEIDALQPGLLEPCDLPPHEQMQAARAWRAPESVRRESREQERDRARVSATACASRARRRGARDDNQARAR